MALPHQDCVAVRNGKTPELQLGNRRAVVVPALRRCSPKGPSMSELAHAKRRLYRLLKEVPRDDLWGDDAALLEELEDNHDLRDLTRAEIERNTQR